MLQPSSIYKQPWEIIKYTIDVSALLAGGATIASLEVKAFDVAGSDVTTTIINASSYSGSEVYITLQNGTANSRYDIRIRLTLSDGQQFEEDLILRVVEYNAS